jgi:hypothetical protein
VALLISNFWPVSTGGLPLIKMPACGALLNPTIRCLGQYQRAGQKLPEQWSAIVGIRTFLKNGVGCDAASVMWFPPSYMAGRNASSVRIYTYRMCIALNTIPS